MDQSLGAFGSLNGLSRATPPGFSSSKSTLDIIARQYESMKTAEKQRHAFVENLISHINTLTNERDEAIRKLQRSEFTCNAYQDRLAVANHNIEDLQKSIDCDRFVLAVIDGDNALFHDEYVQDGAAGGERAAEKLRQSIFDYLKDKPFFQHDFKIMIKVYANLQGLCRPYVENKIIANYPTLYHFVQGFNKANDYVEMIDAGNLKEAADMKIKATLALFHHNLHCKHLLLAASGDNSYAGFLRQFYTPDGGDTSQLTLIETVPFARDMAQLTSRFDTTKFDEIFRNTKIVIDPKLAAAASLNSPTYDTASMSVPWSHTVGKPGAVAATAAGSVRSSASPSMSAATLAVRSVTPTVSASSPVGGSGGGGSSTTTTTTPKTPGAAAAAKVPKEVWVNKYNERVDLPIKYDATIAGALRKRKMCNKYWLRGNCDAGTYCAHNHDGNLSSAELEQLRLIARSCACREGLDCRDPECTDGHRCSAGIKCNKGENCWFTEDQHSVSSEGLKKVSDGSQTYIHVR